MLKNSRWRPRFRLASLLWLMLCVALVIGTYRVAYERGREDTLAMRTFVGRTHVRSYDVQGVMPVTRTGTGVLLEGSTRSFATSRKRCFPIPGTEGAQPSQISRTTFR